MRVVLITGCSSGLGPRLALGFARRGDRAYATMRRAERGAPLAAAASAERLDVRVAELDVTDDRSVQRAVDDILDREGRIDVVVNNAGVVRLGSVELLPDQALRQTFETNLFGVVRVLRAVLPALRAARSGVVVNVSSTAGRVAGLPIHWSYMASKHGLNVLSDSLAMELEPYGIRVLCIEPGFVRTPIFTKGFRPAGTDSPYRTLDEAVTSFMDNGVAGGADADTVAEAVLAAVDRDDGHVHVPVGDDAHLFLAQQASSTDAEMAAFYRQVLGLDAPARSPV
jgi:NAD(P)-dependent dehydrogenase (short-subunit alcohol dehydrogenase family)